MGTKVDGTVRQRVREAREAAGLTQQDMGEILSLTETAYGHYERGRSPFTVDQLVRIARALHRPVTWFLDEPSELTESEQTLVACYREMGPEGKSMLLGAAKGFAHDDC